MADTRHHPILNYLRRVLGPPTGGGLTDAELLRRFVAERDEAAFELLLWRHAATVLHVCRQVLRDADAVEDAFQATFLVFVRKAESISRRELLGGWLHRVAYRVALKAREQIAKQKSLEQTTEDLALSAAPDEADADLRELRRMICEEVNRLPARYRTPIVACFFEGKTHEEAASQLGWPRGTVASRVARGRELLRRRLVRRGVALTAAALTTALSVPSAPAALTRLIHVTMQTVKPIAGSVGLSPRAADLAEGVLNAMYWTRVKIVMAVVLIAGLGGVGATFWGAPRSAAEPPRGEAPKAAADAEKTDEAQTIAQNKALSRLNLKKLALAMYAYEAANKHFMPPPALINKDGKAVLSWRVLILPYLGERDLYEQFKLSEPWDSPHNKKLLSKMPRVFAPPGVKTQQPYSTFYRVFVSPKPKAGDAPNNQTPPAAFVERQSLRFPASFSDGTANTILIVEAGDAVPWTKPEELRFAADKPLPALGGLFRDVFHAAFADGHVETLTKKYDEFSLSTIITSSAGEVMDFEKILARSAVAVEQRKNRKLRQDLDEAQERLRLLQEERDALQGRSGTRRPPNADARLDALKKENARLQKELEKIKEEIVDLNAEVQRRLQKPVQKKGQ